MCQVRGKLTAVEGYLVTLTLMTDLDPEAVTSVTSRVSHPYIYHSDVTGLQPFTEYRVCVSAFGRDVISHCSNTQDVRTGEAGTSLLKHLHLYHISNMLTVKARQDTTR